MANVGGVPSTTGLPTVKAFSSFTPTQSPASTPFVQSDDSSSYSIINARRVAAAAALLAASSGLFMPPVGPSAPVGIPIEMGGQLPQARTVYYQTRSEPPYVEPVVVAPIGIPIDLGGVLPQTRSIYYQARSEPPYVAPVASVLNNGWQQQLAGAPTIKWAAAANYALPVYIAPPVGNNTVTIDKWQQPLSMPPKTATAKPGFGLVPYNTAQVTSTTVAVPVEMGGALPQLRSVYYQARSEPLYIAPVVGPPAPNGWQQPLAGAPKTATAQAGFSFVPYNTAQIAVAIVVPIPIDMGGALPQFRRVYYQARSEPPYVAAVATPAPPSGWQVPLAGAPRTATARAGFSFVPYKTAQVSVTVTLAWQQQLSGIPRKPKAPEGFVLVPFSRLAVTGTLNATEAPDTALFNGSVIVSGTLVTTETPDTALFNGTVLGVISGTLVTTEEPDVLRFFGNAGLAIISGTLVAIDNVDIANIHGRGPVSPPAKPTSKWDYTWYMQEKMRKPTSYYD